MARYFFDTKDGDNDTDESGVELESDTTAITEAVRFAGSMIHDQPDILTENGELIVSVRREQGPNIGTVRIELTHV
jgi:hypothetical protein